MAAYWRPGLVGERVILVAYGLIGGVPCAERDPEGYGTAGGVDATEVALEGAGTLIELRSLGGGGGMVSEG